ncbi:MAG TPA: MaoC family dehydratase [Polyangia bacterium]|nr:MaoC family dehydratase [Polyangia bacterium]
MTSEIATAACVTTIADAPLQVGRKVGPTEWQRMTQERVDQFAEVTGDRNFIHVDPQRARATVFGGTIAHGYLTLSLLAPISQRLLVVTDASTSINYGLNKLRFPGPLLVGAEFRGLGELVDVSALDKGIQVAATFTIEVKGAAKPALVAECLFRYYR